MSTDAPPAKLKKGLGLIHVFAIASGAMISSGLFVLPGLAHAMAGPAVVLAYLLAGLLALPGLLSIAELTTAMPRAGGDYFYISRSMGAAVGTISGLLSWLSLALKSAFALVGMMAFATLVVPSIPTQITRLALCAAFVLLNILGAKKAAGLQVALVAGLFGLMSIYVVFGFPEVNVRHFEPFAPGGLVAVFATTGFVFVSYGGLLKVASVAEECRNPGRVIPLGMILSLLAVLTFYVLMVFVTSGVLPAEQLDGSLTPISDGAQVFLGRGGMIALSVAAIFAFLTTANGGIMAASRYLFALSRDGMLPEAPGRVGARFKTPHVAVLLTGLLVAVALFVKLRVLVEAASVVFMLNFMLANIAVIVLRESGVQNYRPSFRSPLYPWPHILSTIALGFVIVEMGEEAFLILAAFVVAGFCTYWFYGRARTHRESALLHLVQRLTATELVTGTLDSELKRVIRERDEIVRDRLDRIIEDCVVLDLQERMDASAFFTLAAERVADRVGQPPAAVRDLLLAREKETSTAIAPHLAIPHIVVEGEKTFDILLARSSKGIKFSDAAPDVHAVFVLVGSKDERNLHLRALTAIAQIVQGPQFLKLWMRARNEQALRDVMLLGKRQRQ